MAHAGGRPQKQINQKQFETLCEIMCTEEEICHVLDVTDKTLSKWCKETYGKSFSEIRVQKQDYGKASMRREMYMQAKENPTLMIFWSKNHLGMADKVEQKVELYDDDTAIREMDEYFKGTGEKFNKE